MTNTNTNINADDSLPQFAKMIDRVGGDHKNYQYEGVRWCRQNEQDGRGGGLVADEMGLGKTLTMIGLLIENFKRRTLIVVPVALIDQWRDQIHRFTGHSPVVFHGKGRKVDPAVLLSAPVVLTTYGMTAFNNKRPRITPLHDIQWDRVIFDEAHHLRNPKTTKYGGAATLRTPIRWLVTGTPLQNKKKDLVTLATLVGVTCEELVSTDSQRGHGGRMLRRTKDDVGLGLPPVIAHTHNVQWTSKKERALAEEMHSVLQFSNVPPSKLGDISNNMCPRIIVALTRAKQMCTMPAAMGKCINELVTAGAIPANHPSVAGATRHSKLNAVVDQITDNRNNQTKKLVFCTYHQEMVFLTQELRGLGMNVEMRGGKGRKRSRNDDGTEPESGTEPRSWKNTPPPMMLASAGQNADILILQVQTCCEGLNLQAYSEVYFVTPHWNPFVEEQAVARCHRIGQKADVHVYRFFMDGGAFQSKEGDSAMPMSFDNHVKHIQQEKLSLSRALIA